MGRYLMILSQVLGARFSGPWLDSATLCVTNGVTQYNREAYAPAHLVGVERMIVHYGSAQKEKNSSPRPPLRSGRGAEGAGACAAG